MCILCAAKGGSSAPHLTSSETSEIEQLSSNFTVTSGTTGSSGINALVKGASWSGGTGDAVAVRYSFSQATGTSDTSGAGLIGQVTMNATQQSQAEYAMQMWANVANITFVETTGTTDINLRMADMSRVGSPAGWAQGWTSGTQYTHADIVMDKGYNVDMSPGTYQFMAMMHELGHALGLKHSGNYNGATSGNFLSGAEDSRDYTIMSYLDGPITNPWTHNPETPMIYDVAAMQFLYGANHNYNAGDTTYTFNGTNHVLTIWDGAGTDTVSAAGTSSANTIDLREGIANMTTIGQTNLWVAFGANLENATGGNGADRLYGNALGNLLNGGAGNDTMVGGAGNDSYVVSAAGDVITENSGEGTDSVTSAVTYTLLTNLENLTLSGSGNINGTGNALNNALTGNSGINLLDGGLGDDQLDGVAGGDTLTGGAGVDTFIIKKSDIAVNITISDFSAATTGEKILLQNFTQAIDFVSLTITQVGSDSVITLENGMTLTLKNVTASQLTAASFSESGAVEPPAPTEPPASEEPPAVVIAGTSGHDVLNGTTGDDTINGLGGNDTLYGGDGNDTLIGGSGYNLLDGGNGDDVIIVTGKDNVIGGAGNDSVDASASSSANVINVGDGDDSVVAGSGGNNISGGVGDDTLNGGTGNNTVDGGDGNDSIVVGGGRDKLYGGLGNDTIDGGNGANVIYAGSDDDSIVSGTSGDYLFGDGGNDTINGGGSRDIIDGGAGNDVLIGGTGSDYFNFYVGAGADVVSDFTGAGTTSGDLIRISNLIYVSTSEALSHVSYVGGNALIDLGVNGSITLAGVGSGLIARDFAII